MIPNMYKIAGELTPTVFHVAARSLATQALSIFGDHSRRDGRPRHRLGACWPPTRCRRRTDFALIAQAATLEARIPFIHFFDGFRTSHEVDKIEQLADDDLRAMIDDDLVRAHRARALSPDRPFMRGTAQNPDVYFQAREAVNPFYLACPASCRTRWTASPQLTGRQYHLFDYAGAPDAERVIVMMGSGAEAAQETVELPARRAARRSACSRCASTGPSRSSTSCAALPPTARAIAVLDRTKEPGSVGEPLYLDVVTRR